MMHGHYQLNLSKLYLAMDILWYREYKRFKSFKVFVQGLE